MRKPIKSEALLNGIPKITSLMKSKIFMGIYFEAKLYNRHSAHAQTYEKRNAEWNP
jgi:hypothetical protein